MDNILSNLPVQIHDEITDVLVNSENIRIERILSKGQSSPAEFWYDQDEHEWVIVLQGEAILEWQDERSDYKMKTGDFVNIPAHCKHRVKWTDPDKITIWLAVFYTGEK